MFSTRMFGRLIFYCNLFFVLCVIQVSQVFAQSENIFWGKIFGADQEFFTAEQLDFKFFNQKNPENIYNLDSFGCGFYQEQAIFWVSTNQLLATDTLSLEIINNITHDSISTGIVLNKQASGIIHLGEFGFDGVMKTEHILISENDSLNNDNHSTSVGDNFDFNSDDTITHRDFLQRPFPNPFQPSRHKFIRLPITLHANCPVRLYIYDILGNLVWKTSSLISGSGENYVLWNGRNFLNKLVTSGIYILTVLSDGAVTRTLITVIQ
ncbi:MAG: T9SS type A sorting domain-containing protein [Deferribacteres bacterium]|nr:T9SS type A sorting domain-containing protein [candidate division KSB1 bacterium]MCB9501542.1 T9SS type A sorting domain-containing protein [Deferribacteres bacterium]